MHRTFFSALVLLLGGLLSFLLLRPAVIQPACDFAQFYFAGELVAEGKVAQVYQPKAYEPLIAKLKAEGETLQPFVYLNRPAFSAPLYWPYALLSYRTGASIFLMLNFALWGLLIWKLPIWLGAPGILRIWLVSLFPFACAVGLGQDTLAITILVAYSMFVLVHRNETGAGVLLGLCLIKPHLIVFLPVLLLFEKKYRALVAFLVTGIVLAGLSVAFVGIQGIGDWIELLKAPTTDYHPADMGTIRALGMNFGTIAALTAAAIALASAAVAFLSGGYRERLSIALMLALLLNTHAYWSDYALLGIVALVTPNRFIRYAILVPWPYFFPGPMWPMVLMTILFLVLMAVDGFAKTSQLLSWQRITQRIAEPAENNT